MEKCKIDFWSTGNVAGDCSNYTSSSINRLCLFFMFRFSFLFLFVYQHLAGGCCFSGAWLMEVFEIITVIGALRIDSRLSAHCPLCQVSTYMKNILVQLNFVFVTACEGWPTFPSLPAEPVWEGKTQSILPNFKHPIISLIFFLVSWFQIVLSYLIFFDNKWLSFLNVSLWH